MAQRNPHAQHHPPLHAHTSFGKKGDCQFLLLFPKLAIYLQLLGMKEEKAELFQAIKATTIVWQEELVARCCHALLGLESGRGFRHSFEPRSVGMRSTCLCVVQTCSGLDAALMVGWKAFKLLFLCVCTSPQKNETNNTLARAVRFWVDCFSFFGWIK